MLQTQVLILGRGDDVPSKGCRQEELLEKVHCKSRRLDAPKSSPAQLLPSSRPEFFQILAGIDDPVAQGIEPDIEGLQS